MNNHDDSLATMSPYQGVRAEVDLIGCQLQLFKEPQAEAFASFELCAERKLAEPVLQSWGQGISLINPEDGSQRQLSSWRPGLKYGLVINEQQSVLYQQDAALTPFVVKTAQLIYPAQYTRRPGQGPFDLFAEPAAGWLAVVNRQEAWVQIFDLNGARELGRYQFKALSGSKVVNVALEPEHQRVWVCGLDDRQLWEWNLASNQVQAHSGPWRQPAAFLREQDSLWLLDASTPLKLLRLGLPDLNPLAEIKLAGSSYGKETDTPGDLLTKVGKQPWLAVLSFENLPDPLTPKLSLYDSEQQRLHRSFQPAQRNWPVLIAEFGHNPIWKQLQENALKYSQHEFTESAAVKALLQSYGLRLEQMQGKILILKAEKAPLTDFPMGTRARVMAAISEALLKQHGLRLAEQTRTEAERQLVILAEQLVQLLRQHDQLEVVLYQLFDGLSIRLQLERSQLAVHQMSSKEELLLLGLNEAGSEARGPSLPQLDPLPSGWAAVADTLNSRIVQLNQELEPVWELDSSLMGIYRPGAVYWFKDGSFMVLDNDRSEISAWDLQGQQLWAVQTDGSVWHRLEPVVMEQGLRLILLDREQQVLIRVSPEGTVDWDADELAQKPEQMLDFCLNDQNQLWILQQNGRLRLIDQQAQTLRELKLEGFPNSLALSRDNSQLAVFDSQLQHLMVVDLKSESQIQKFDLRDRHFRLQDPVRLVWTDQSNLLLINPYLLVRFNLQTQQPQKMLIQALRRRPGQMNQAPEANFVVRQQREAHLQGGSQASLRKMLEKVSLFDQGSQELYDDLIACLQTKVFNRGDLIVTKGEHGADLFLIRQGQVEVLGSSASEVVARMGSGDVFGEVALMLGVPRNASIRAASYTETFTLNQTALDALLPEYPDLRERLLKLAQERATQQQMRKEAELEQVASRVMALRSQNALGSPRSSQQARTQLEMPEVTLEPLDFWVRHQGSSQLAKLNRQGQSLYLFESGDELLQPVAALESGDGLWVLDAGHNRLLLLDAEARVLASYGEWQQHALNQPRAMALAADGSVWIANTGASELLQVSAQGELLAVIAAGRAPVSIQILPDQSLLVADQRLHTVSEFSAAGLEKPVYGTARKFGRDENLLFAPEYAERLANGHTLISDTGNSRILELDAEGRIVWSLLAGGNLRMTRPTLAQRLANGHTLVEHSNRSRWLEVNQQNLPVWRYSLPVDGFVKA